MVESLTPRFDEPPVDGEDTKPTEIIFFREVHYEPQLAMNAAEVLMHEVIKQGILPSSHKQFYVFCRKLCDEIIAPSQDEFFDRFSFLSEHFKAIGQLITVSRKEYQEALLQEFSGQYRNPPTPAELSNAMFDLVEDIKSYFQILLGISNSSEE